MEVGLGVETRFVGWGAAVADLDNDGLPDLAYVTGSVYPEVEATHPQYPYRTPNVVFRNLGDGRFEELIEEAGPGMSEPHSSRGAAFGDYDNDGDIDIAIVNMNEPPTLLRSGCSSPVRRAGAGTCCHRPVELLLCQRPAAALRPRICCVRRPRGAMAVGS